MIFMHLTLKRKPHIGYHTINKEEIKGMLTYTFYGAHMQELSTISLQQMKMLNQEKEEVMHTIHANGSLDGMKEQTENPN